MDKLGPGYYAAGFTVALFGILKAIMYMVIFALMFRHDPSKDWFLIALLCFEETVCVIYIVCNIYLIVGIAKNNSNYLFPWLLVVIIFLLLQIVRFFLQFQDITIWANIFSVAYLVVCLSIVLKISTLIENEEKRTNINAEQIINVL